MKRKKTYWTWRRLTVHGEDEDEVPAQELVLDTVDEADGQEDEV